MKPRPAVGVETDPIQHLDDRPDFDVEAGLFPDLAAHRLGERLADFHCAARQAPLALERFVRPPHEQHPAAVDDNPADADDGTFGKLSHRAEARYSPITLTTTRFFRWPSNSA